MAKTKAKTSIPKGTSKATVKKSVASSRSAKAPKQKAAKDAECKPVVAEIMDEDHPENTSTDEVNKAYSVESSDTDDSIENSVDDSADDSIDEPIETKQLATIESSKALTSSDPLVIYLNEIRRYKVLTKEEEQAIAKKYFETKDPEAAQTLVKANLRFVVKIAAEYSKFGAKMIDLIQEGNVGLMHAVREFNPYRGAKLITYAVWWIRGYIQEYLMRQYSMVRIGTTQNQRKLFYQLQKEKDALDAMGIEANTALLSDRLGIPENEVRDMAQRMSGRDVSLDKPLDSESGSASLGDMQRNLDDLPLDERLAKAEQLSILSEKLEELREELSDREKIILDERVLNDEPLTLQEIGEKYGITREAVRQMEARLMKKIKNKMDGDGN